MTCQQRYSQGGIPTPCSHGRDQEPIAVAAVARVEHPITAQNNLPRQLEKFVPNTEVRRGRFISLRYKEKNDCIRLSAIKIIIGSSAELARGRIATISYRLIPANVEPRPITQNTSSLTHCRE